MRTSKDKDSILNRIAQEREKLKPTNKSEMQTEQTIDPAKAKQAQKEYCKTTGMPHFAPSDGRCYRCYKDIYQIYSVEKASTQLITGCPHCFYSYVD